MPLFDGCCWARYLRYLALQYISIVPLDLTPSPSPPPNGPPADVRSGARAVCPGPVLTRSGLRRAPSGGRRPGASGSRPAVRRPAARPPSERGRREAVRDAVRRPASGVGVGRRRSCLVCRHASWLLPLASQGHHAIDARPLEIVNEAHSSADSSGDAENYRYDVRRSSYVIYQDWSRCSTGADVAGI